MSELEKSILLVLAVTLHNIPEGMAVGVAFAGIFTKNAIVSLTGALALSVGIAIQNLPEGAIISMPLISTKATKPKAFLYGVLSGIVEPIASFFTILLTSAVSHALPYILTCAAGAMIYVVVQELIPEQKNDEKENYLGTIFFAIGFALMMALDVALG